MKKVRESSLETLQNLIGNNAGQKVYDFYQKQVVEDDGAGAVEVQPGDGPMGEEDSLG